VANVSSNANLEFLDDSFSGLYDAVGFSDGQLELLGMPLIFAASVRIPASSFDLADSSAPDLPPMFAATFPVQFGGHVTSDVVTMPANAPVQSVREPLTWDGAGDGYWDEARWHTRPPNYPNGETIAAAVNTAGNTVTVRRDELCHSLNVGAGEVAISPGASLEAANHVNVGANGSLQVGGTLRADSLNTAGTVNFTGTATLADLTLSGGRLTTSTDLSVSRTLNLNGGKLIANGKVVVDAAATKTRNAPDLEIGNSGTPGDLTLPTFAIPAGLQLWLDADQLGLTDGTAVSSWTDAAGNGNDAENGPGGTFKTNAINGKPAVHFNTSQWLYTTTEFPRPYTILSVSQMTGGTSQRLISSADGNRLYGYWNGLRDSLFLDGDYRLSGGPAAGTEPHLYVTTVAEGQPTAFYSDGTYISGNSNASSDMGRLKLNGWHGGGETSDGDIAEIMVFNRVLSYDELDDVGGYLNAKYNLGIGAYTGGLGTVAYGDLVMADDTHLRLNADGSGQASFESITAGDGATIHGIATAKGDVVVGSSTGQLNVDGGLTMDETSTYRWELGDSTADLVSVQGDLTLAEGWTLQLIDAGVGISDGDLLLFSYTDSADIGQVNFDLRQVTGPGFEDWHFDNPSVYQSRRGVYLSGVTVVPEPPTLVLLCIGVVGLLFLRRRGRSVAC